MVGFMDDVYGYENIKKELGVICDSILKENSDDNLNPNDNIKGILIVGPEGSGKTLMMKEFSKFLNLPTYIFEGISDNYAEELQQVYNQARTNKKAIVLIDELDSLVDKDSKLERILRTELDGLDKTNNVITLASANHYYDLSKQLRREGRFDYKFCLNANAKTGESMIRNLVKKYNLVFDENEILEICEFLRDSLPSKIENIFKMTYHRYGKSMSTNNIFDILAKYSGLMDESDFEVEEHDLYRVAIHEAGHILYSFKYTNNIKFLKALINGDGGKTIGKPIYDSVQAREEDIEVSLAGYLAEELIFKKRGLGSPSDYERAFDASFRLISRSCIFGIENYETYGAPYKDYCGTEGILVREKYDKRVKKFLKQKEKLVKSKLKKDLNNIVIIANFLAKNHNISRKELISLIKNN